MSDGTRFFADDRGNVVDFYDGDECVARLDREAVVNGVPDQLAWDGSGEIEQWARDNGYGDQIDRSTRL